ncbi:MAG: YHS domain-containing protein [Candidatus Azotimanducaceae bacterium]|jgi:YHS domain-containing protein
MKSRILSPFLTALLMFIGTFASSVSAAITPEARQENFSLSKKNLALSGYDPVSYFQSQPLKGSKAITHSQRGITYRFTNEANRMAFLAEPTKYEPQYGGWCAWAMYDDGGRTKPNPKSFTITDGKLYVFYDGLLADTLKFWNEAAAESSEAALIAGANRHWKNQVGE